VNGEQSLGGSVNVKKKQGRPKGIKRGIGKFFRITEKEQQMLEYKAAATGLPEADFIRCRVFGYSFESLGGHEPRRKSKPLAPPLSETQNPPNPLA
jgi:hypothetical protein